MTPAAAICGLRERTIERWGKTDTFPDLPAALKLAEKAGVPVERFAER